MQPGEASTSARDHVAAEVMRSGEASSARTVAAGVPPLRKRPERASMQSGETSFSLAGTVAAGVPERWPKGKRSGARAGETSREPEQGHAAAAKGSGASSCEAERYAETPVASAQRQPVVAALCFAAVAAAGSGPSTSAKPAEEPMKTPSPKSPLDYGAGGSGAPSSADDAAPAPAPARPQAKRKGTDARGSVGGDDEGCSSPAKRGPVAQEEKPTPISVEPSVQSETRASSGKSAPRPFDLNLLPTERA